MWIPIIANANTKCNLVIFTLSPECKKVLKSKNACWFDKDIFECSTLIKRNFTSNLIWPKGQNLTLPSNFYLWGYKLYIINFFYSRRPKGSEMCIWNINFQTPIIILKIRMCQNLHLYLYQHDDDKSHTPRDPEPKAYFCCCFSLFWLLKGISFRLGVT